MCKECAINLAERQILEHKLRLEGQRVAAFQALAERLKEELARLKRGKAT